MLYTHNKDNVKERTKGLECVFRCYYTVLIVVSFRRVSMTSQHFI